MIPLLQTGAKSLLYENQFIFLQSITLVVCWHVYRIHIGYDMGLCAWNISFHRSWEWIVKEVKIDPVFVNTFATFIAYKSHKILYQIVITILAPKGFQ